MIQKEMIRIAIKQEREKLQVLKTNIKWLEEEIKKQHEIIKNLKVTKRKLK